MTEDAQLLIALVVASWSALGVALKCRDKIDAARDLVWRISARPHPRNEEMIRFIMLSDIVGFMVALVLVLLSVGSLLVAISVYLFGGPGALLAATESLMSAGELPPAVATMFLAVGGAMLAGAAVTGVFALRDYPTIKRLALEALAEAND